MSTSTDGDTTTAEEPLPAQLRERGARGDVGRGDEEALEELLAALDAAHRGDFSVRLPERHPGLVGDIGVAYNRLMERNAAVVDELERVGRTVGREGRLTERFAIGPVNGGWSAQADAVNGLMDDLVRPTTEVARVIMAVADGDLSQKMALEFDGQPVKGEFARIGTAVNTMVDQLSSFAAEVSRVAREVGTDGKLGGQAQVDGVSGIWEDLTDNVNNMASNLTSQVRNIAHVATAVANGDLSQKITVEAKGEVAALADTINTMVDQLSSFADEVTRVAREVGTDGKLGGQAQVDGVSGIWEDLTDNVNNMASNLTSQVRNIAHVATAVANGDLSQKITVEAKGEVAALADTINSMTDTLRTFADEVTRVAREVGTDGELGGQADVPGVAGIWEDLTDNVNQLAANLTTQVRAIAEVATAVTQGDLTRSITVDAQGEVAELKDNINQMIGNLKATTRKNAEQDWLKTNLAKISQMMQGQRDLEALSRLIMSELTPTVSAQHGAFFLTDTETDGDPELRLIASYGFTARKGVSNRFAFGESLVGQAAVEKVPILVTDAPPDYIRIGSGLGEAQPVNVIVLPVLFEEQVLGVVELASFRPFSDVDRSFLEQVIETIGVVLNTIQATMRTEELLGQSQRLTEELQNQQEELRQANAELHEKARLLADQNRNIEIKNQEIELARRGLEEKAEQLALSSKYKSEFLANVSHELRTPLNSLLILTQLLEENEEENLTDEQVDFVASISDAGRKLLGLINDILDLSKVESGKMEVTVAPVAIRALADAVEQSFRPIAQQKEVGFEVSPGDDLPETVLTDEKRLRQILNNLLSNAVKFTDAGRVELTIERAGADVGFTSPGLRDAQEVVAFAVSDTGIGIPEEKIGLIFEAFQQADGTANRRYGGTGLGLSISREIARLLGGEIRVASTVGEGSTFTLYLPGRHPGGAIDEGGAGVAGALAPPGADGRPAELRRVLVVSDDPARRDDLRGTVAGWGASDVTAATHAEGARSAQGEIQPTLLLIDLEPAGTPPFALLRDLADEPPSPAFSVVTYAHRELLRTERAHLRSCAEVLDLRHVRTLDGLRPAGTSVALDGRVDDVRGEEDPGREGTGEAGRRGAGEAGRRGPLVGRRILVVDDDERNADALRRALERRGAEVVTAGDGRRALELLDRPAGFDLVLLDIMMPEMDGYETVRAIRELPQHRSLPVIAVTARAMRGDRELALSAGASDYIAKPVDVTELIATIREWLASPHATEDAGA